MGESADLGAAAAAGAAVLADRTRLGLVLLLRDGELCVSDLVRLTGRRQATVSHHLAVLLRSSVVASRRAGRNVYYRLATPSAPGTISIDVGGVTLVVKPR